MFGFGITRYVHYPLLVFLFILKGPNHMILLFSLNKKGCVLLWNIYIKYIHKIFHYSLFSETDDFFLIVQIEPVTVDFSFQTDHHGRKIAGFWSALLSYYRSDVLLESFSDVLGWEIFNLESFWALRLN